jgi:hypothetical protein
LLVSDRDGAPLAPLYQNLQSAGGLHTTRGSDVQKMICSQVKIHCYFYIFRARIFL